MQFSSRFVIEKSYLRGKMLLSMKSSHIVTLSVEFDSVESVGEVLQGGLVADK